MNKDLQPEIHPLDILNDLHKQLKTTLEQHHKLSSSLLAKIDEMLLFPLAKTVRTESQGGKTVITEIHPAKWSLSDVGRLYEASQQLIEEAKGLEDRIAGLEQETLRLPPWVPGYIAAWGMRKNNRAPTVQKAAEMAGTTTSNVRNLRFRSPQFRRMEYMARHADGDQIASLMEAGLRGNAVVIFQAFMAQVNNGNTQATLKAMEWLQSIPTINLSVSVMSDAELKAKYHELLEDLGSGHSGDGTEGPGHSGSAGASADTGSS